MGKWILISVVAMILGGCSDPEKRAFLDASVSCQAMLRQAAKNPSSAKIPSPDKSKKTEKGLTLEWSHGSGLAFMNGFGAMIDSSALCVTSADGSHIRDLMVDGESFYQDADSRAESAKIDALFQEIKAKREKDSLQAADRAAEAAAAAAAAAAATLDTK